MRIEKRAGAQAFRGRDSKQRGGRTVDILGGRKGREKKIVSVTV